MADAPIADETELAPPRRPRRWTRPLRWLVVALLGLAALAMVAVWGVDTGPGHRFILDRIAQIAPSTGLRIRIGRIDGSIWGTATLRDVRVYDPQGLFLESPEIDLDWRPAAWLANRLHINSLESDLVILHRLPRLRPSGKDRPILPGFDIHIGKLDIRHLRIDSAVTGTKRVGRIQAKADIDPKSTRLNSSHLSVSRMPSSA